MPFLLTFVVFIIVATLHIGLKTHKYIFLYDLLSTSVKESMAVTCRVEIEMHNWIAEEYIYLHHLHWSHLIC